MNWDYIAGFLDGDGHISLVLEASRHGTYNVQASINFSQKTPQVLQRIRDFIGAGHIRSHGNGYTLHIERREDVRRVFSKIEGSVIQKKPELELLREYLRIPTKDMGRKETKLKLIQLVESMSQIGKHRQRRMISLERAKVWAMSLPADNWKLRSDAMSRKLKGRKPSPQAYEGLIEYNKEFPRSRDESGKFVGY